MLPFECLVLNMEPIEGEKSKMATECSSQRRLQSWQFQILWRYQNHETLLRIKAIH